jgi:hypothetical protein
VASHKQTVPSHNLVTNSGSAGWKATSWMAWPLTPRLWTRSFLSKSHIWLKKEEKETLYIRPVSVLYSFDTDIPYSSPWSPKTIIFHNGVGCHTYIYTLGSSATSNQEVLFTISGKKSTLYGFIIGNVLTGSEESMFQTCNFMHRRNCQDIFYEVLTPNRQFWAIMTLVPEFVLCSVSG